jgi:hypothetical protein
VDVVVVMPAKKAGGDEGCSPESVAPEALGALGATADGRRRRDRRGSSVEEGEDKETTLPRPAAAATDGDDDENGSGAGTTAEPETMSPETTGADGPGDRLAKVVPC